MSSTSYAVGVRTARGARRYLGAPTWRCPTGLRVRREQATRFADQVTADRAARAVAGNAATVIEVTVFEVRRIIQDGRTGDRWHALDTAGTRAAGVAVVLGVQTAMMAATRPTPVP